MAPGTNSIFVSVPVQPLRGCAAQLARALWGWPRNPSRGGWSMLQAPGQRWLSPPAGGGSGATYTRFCEFGPFEHKCQICPTFAHLSSIPFVFSHFIPYKFNKFLLKWISLLKKVVLCFLFSLLWIICSSYSSSFCHTLCTAFGFADIWRKGCMNSSDSLHVYLLSCVLSFSVPSWASHFLPPLAFLRGRG